MQIERRSQRVVVVWCETGSAFGTGRQVPAGTGDAWALTPAGNVERLPASVDPHDLGAIAAYYGAGTAVEAPIIEFAVGVIEDGPEVGRHVYTVRELGAITRVGGRRYEVVNVDVEPVMLSLAAEPGA